MATARKRLLFVLAALLMSSCAGSIFFAIQRSVDQALDCECEQDKQHEEISLKVRDLSLKEREFHRYYRAWCCGREVFLECRARVQDHHIAGAPPAQQLGPSGDVSWSCWQTDDPTKKEIDPEKMPKMPLPKIEPTQ